MPPVAFVESVAVAQFGFALVRPPPVTRMKSVFVNAEVPPVTVTFAENGTLMCRSITNIS